MPWSEAWLTERLQANPDLRQRNQVLCPWGTSGSPSTNDQLEGLFQAEVMALAKQCGWLTYHTRDSRGSVKGYPDVSLTKPGKPFLLVELKREHEKPTHEQAVWLDVLQHAVGFEAHLWRPSDMEAIVALLKR